MDLVKPYASFVRASYVAGILWVAPILSLPFMALSLVGERLVGYLAMSLTLFNALLQFPSSSSQALFASLSASEVNSGWKVKRAFRDTVLITICASLALAVLGRAVLELFGEDYAKNGYLVLLLLIPSAVVASANLICNAILKVRGHLGTLMIVNFLGFSVSSLVWVLNLKELGIIAVPFGLILGHAIMLSAHGLIALRRHKS
jgi:O-antigen/teichoic acid export membrane protein